MLEIKTVPQPTLPKQSPSTFATAAKPAPSQKVIAEKVESAYVEDLSGTFSPKTIPFILMHIACFTVIFVGVSLPAVLLCLGLYAIRMFGLTAGYHRYFSHRTFKTSRFVQFLFALLGTMAVQKGPLWWAAHHRRHHKYTDQEGDVHSPVKDGFWWSHIGWVVSRRFDATDWNAIKDFARFRELRWLNTYHVIPGIALAVACFFGGVLFGESGWQWLVWGFVISTVLLYHGTFTVNSLAHMWGSRRYKTTDDSRNNFWIALWTGGEGWHNNHHHYMASVKQGFFWWEVDFSYYTLRVMSWFRLVWDLRMPPEHLLAPAENS
ncbi:MAG TPA: acyl-CoA desaturase [Blastocatellia bacterium]|nr:acyl-CoA desaturase [Blastocatellia bacterium]